MSTLSTGIVIGVTTAVVMVGLLFNLVFNQNNYLAIYGNLFIAVTVLAPLLLTNIVLSILYWKRNYPVIVFAWMWLPSLLVLVLLMMFEGVRMQERKHHEAAHPSIREVHVNLTGRSLWLDPKGAGMSSGGGSELRGNSPQEFVHVTRYYGVEYYGTSDKMPEYEVARLADSFHEMRIYYGHPAETSPSIKPVNHPAAFPDVKAFISRLSFNGGESAVIEYWYYHYPDYIDVVPVISLAGNQSMDLWGTGVPLVEIHIANLGARHIARLEINGQSMNLGSDAIPPESNEDSECRSRNFAAYAVGNLNTALKVRWQSAQANPTWQEASVVVPEFSSMKPPRGRIRSTSVDLYFQSDGSVVAERSQDIDLAQGKMAVRTSGPSAGLHERPPCGFVPDRYDGGVLVIRG